jgi:CxxC motif-containing protein
MEKIALTCIGCPLGCQIEVSMENGKVAAVTGNTCPRGDAYARKEVTAPTRIVTSTVRVSGSRTGAVTVSCKTRTDVPKNKIFDCIRALRGVSASCPVHIGDVLVPNAAGTGVDVIATKEVR